MNNTRPSLLVHPSSFILHPFFHVEAPTNRVAQEPLVHGVEQGLEGVAVGEVAEPAAARLTDPAGGGDGLAVIRAVPQQDVDTPLVIRWRVLLIGDEERAY